MTFTVSDILSYAQGKGGFSRSAHFNVNFTFPSTLTGYNAQDLSFTASSLNIPSVGITSTAVRRGGTTYQEYFPLNVEFAPCNITFLSDASGINLQLFRDWLSLIYETDENNASPYSVAYRNDYVAPTVMVYHYDSMGNIITQYEFYEMWPEMISDINLSWASFDNIVTIPVTFRYRKYTQTNFNGSTASSSINPSVTVGAQQSAQITNLPDTPIAGNYFGGGGSTGQY